MNKILVIGTQPPCPRCKLLTEIVTKEAELMRLDAEISHIAYTCDEDVEKYNAIRNKAKELVALIESECPESREKTLAFTKIEEASLWANSSIARNSEIVKKI